MAKHTEKDVLLDHEYDGIQELDNRLPPWWLYMFYISIIWAAVYLIHYHVLGTGDSSYVEYMKEIDPNWKPPAAESGFSIGYKSPFSARDDLTPLKRAELARLASLDLKRKDSEQTANVSDLGFEELILAAMKVSNSEDLDKLKNAFPAIWQKYEAIAENRKVEPTAEVPAEPVAEISPLTDEASLAAGKSTFITNCATCHGQSGEGGIGPNMTDEYYLHGSGMTNTVSVIKNGVPAKGMISWRGILNEQQILEVASYIQTLQGTNPPNGKAPQGEKIIAAE
jgi:mono/diheme cytochrome c family protein